MMATNITRIGAYELLRNIGRGGMAEVFLARHTATGLQVALKQVAEGTDGETRRFSRRSSAAPNLQEQFCRVNAHVPTVYDHGSSMPASFYVAMEYIDGENLSELIFRGPVPIGSRRGHRRGAVRFLEHAPPSTDRRRRTEAALR